MRRLLLTCLLVSYLFMPAARLCAAETPETDPLVPAVTDVDDTPEGDTDPESAEMTAESADGPMDPAIDRSARRGFKPGTILEFWLLKPGEKFSAMPAVPALTGMIDDSRQYFYAGSMVRDPELKNYASRQGVLQWTTYFRVTRPGKHVFAITAVGPEQTEMQHAGVALAINDDVKVAAPVDLEESAVADFSEPGWYKLQIRLWWTYPEKPNYEDFAITLKVREPGTLSLRPLNRKDLFYKYPF